MSKYFEMLNNCIRIEYYKSKNWLIHFYRLIRHSNYLLICTMYVFITAIRQFAYNCCFRNMLHITSKATPRLCSSQISNFLSIFVRNYHCLCIVQSDVLLTYTKGVNHLLLCIKGKFVHIILKALRDKRISLFSLFLV